MQPPIREQRNPYKGQSPRGWGRVKLVALTGASAELELLADTGCPYDLIVSATNMSAFGFLDGSFSQSNYGLLPGGWLRVTIPEVGFDRWILGHESDAVVSTCKQSSADFEGLMGL